MKCISCPLYIGKNIRSLTDHIKENHKNQMNIILNKLSIENIRRNQMVNDVVSDDNDDQEMDVDFNLVRLNSSNENEHRMKLEMIKLICKNKLKYGMVHNGTSSTFIDGLNFGIELYKTNQLTEFNCDLLNKLSKNTDKQLKIILDNLDSNYKTDRFIRETRSSREELKWYYFPIEETVMNILLGDNEFLLTKLIEENERRIVPGTYKGI